MAILTIPKENRTINEPSAIADYLAGIGVNYEIWEPESSVAADAPAEEILAAYTTEIDKLKDSGGFVTTDGVEVKTGRPGRAGRWAKFNPGTRPQSTERGWFFEGGGGFSLFPVVGAAA